jgi:hypothetical protein
MGDDSKPRNVLSTTSGREQMYWIRQNKGIDYRVNESHILSLKRSRTEGPHKNGDVLNINVKEFLEKSPKFKSNYKGYKVSVEFENENLSVLKREEELNFFIDNNSTTVKDYIIFDENLDETGKIKFLADSLGYITYFENKKLYISKSKAR